MRSPLAALLAALLTALLLAAPTSAWADVVPPAGDCEGKKEGQACKDFESKPGACGTVTYTRTLPPSAPGAAPNTSQGSYFGCRTGVTPTVASSGGGGKGCAVAPVGLTNGPGAALALAALALTASAARRRPRG